MSNFIPIKGIGSGLLVTRGYGGNDAGVIGAGILSLSSGRMRIDIVKNMSGVFLTFKDSGGNNINVPIPMTSDQIAGLKYAIFKIVRQSSNLLVYMDGSLLSIISLHSVVTYGTTAYVMSRRAGSVFDVRMIPSVVNEEAHNYYLQSISDYSGDSVLPNSEKVSSIPTIPGSPSSPTVSPITTSADIAMDGGGFVAKVYLDGGVAKLSLSDSFGLSHITILPLTSDQLSGLAYGIIKLTRQGSNLVVTLDQKIVETIPISSVIPYGNNLYLGKNSNNSLFDVRLIPAVIDKPTSDYYHDTVTTRSGDSLLPN